MVINNRNNPEKLYATLKTARTDTDEKVDDYISILTVDEVVFAGAMPEKDNNNYYLYTNNLSWWTISPRVGRPSGDVGMIVGNNGSIFWGFIRVSDNYQVRPSIVLKQNIKLVSGDGTQGSPYTVLNDK